MHKDTAGVYCTVSIPVYDSVSIISAGYTGRNKFFVKICVRVLSLSVRKINGKCVGPLTFEIALDVKVTIQ